MKKLLFVLLFICSAPIAFAHQRIDTRPLDTIKPYSARFVFTDDIDLFASYNRGNYSYLELGIARTKFAGSCFPTSLAYSFSSEFRMGDKFIAGPKVGFWSGNMIAFGANAIYYTDFNSGSLRFRPEIGFGVRFFKIVYGYNCAITNRHFRGINTNMITFAAYIPVKKIKEK